LGTWKETFDQLLDEFEQLLVAAGYDGDDKIIELVRQVKRGQARELREEDEGLEPNAAYSESVDR